MWTFYCPCYSQPVLVLRCISPFSLDLQLNYDSLLDCFYHSCPGSMIYSFSQIPYYNCFINFQVKISQYEHPFHTTSVDVWRKKLWWFHKFEKTLDFMIKQVSLSECLRCFTGLMLSEHLWEENTGCTGAYSNVRSQEALSSWTTYLDVIHVIYFVTTVFIRYSF